MKQKLVESLAPKKPGRKKAGYLTTVQTAGDILTLNVYHDAATASWNRRKYGDLLGLDMRVYGCCCTRAVCSRAAFAEQEEEKAVQEAMKALLACRYTEETLVLIDQTEREYACGEREKRE